MTINNNHFKVIFTLIIFSLLINSCKKNQPTCSGNCVNINVNGKAYIKTNNAALPNVPVEINWGSKRYCLFCSSYKVASGKTDNSGNFNFNITIDSTYFKDYFLGVSVPSLANYITIPGANDNRFYQFDLNALQNLKFEFYPKTYMTIKLHRILNDNFDYFSVEHNFKREVGYIDYIITKSQFATDTTLRVETSADIYTRIVWNKSSVGGPSIQHTDSLICTNNGNNIFNIDY